MTRTPSAIRAAFATCLGLWLAPQTIARGDSPVSPVVAPAASPVSPVREMPLPEPEVKKFTPEEIEVRIELAKLKGEMRKHAREQTELAATIEELRRENAELRRTAINKENERNVLIQKLAAAQLASREKEKADDSAVAISTELSNARLSIDSLKVRVEKLTAEKERAEGDAKLTRQSLAGANEKLAAADGELAALKTELDSARRDATVLAEQLQALADEHKRATAEAAEKMSQNTRTSDEIAKSLADAQRESALAKLQVDTLTERHAALALKSETLERERDEAVAARDSLKGQVAEFDAALTAATKAHDEQSRKIGELEKQHVEMTASAAAAAEDFRKQLADTEDRLAVSLRAYQIKQEEFEALQQKLAAGEAMAAQLSERLVAVEAQLSDAEKRATLNEKAAGELALAQSNFKQMQAQTADVAEENARLKTRLALMQQQRPQPAPASAPVAASAPARPVAQQAAPSEPAPTAPESAPSPAPAPASVRTHTVTAGETLSSIARKYYGGAEFWKELYEANRDQLKSPNALTLGMKLRVP